jgi:hypothetical protein
MPGLPWIRLDTGFPSNSKILGLIADRKQPAALGYVCALAWSGGQGTDGFIPEIAAPLMHLTTVSAQSLCSSGLFIPTLGGWVINDWAEHQQTTAETQARSAKAQAAARVRWDKQRREEAAAGSNGHAVSTADRNAKRNARRNAE